MSTIIEIDTRDAIESILALEKRVESYNQLTKQLEAENKTIVKTMQELANAGNANSEQYRQNNEQLVKNRKLLIETKSEKEVLTDAIKNQNKQLESAYRLQTQESKSLNEMRKQLVDLRVIYDNLSEQESDYAKSVLANINEMNEAVKAQEEQQGIYTRNVGDYYRNASKSATTAATAFRGAGNVATATNSTLRTMGVESKVVTSGVEGLTIAQTTLTGASRLLNTVAEAGGVQAAINNALDVMRTKQQERLAAATAAQTAVQNASTLSTKAAAVATYLWNAALAATPIAIKSIGFAASAAFQR